MCVLTIANLDYLEELTEAKRIDGGVSTRTSSNTYATDNLAYASADSNASGQSTGASTKASTEIRNLGYFKFSSAQADATAFAVDSSGTSFSRSSSSSTYISVRVP